MRPPRVFNAKEIETINAFRRSDVPWSAIGVRLNASYEQVRKAVDLEYAERKRTMINEWRNAHHKTTASLMCASRGPDIPAVVLIERDSAMQFEQSITAAFCGDPLPGRSALDKKRASATA